MKSSVRRRSVSVSVCVGFMATRLALHVTVLAIGLILMDLCTGSLQVGGCMEFGFFGLEQPCELAVG